MEKNDNYGSTVVVGHPQQNEEGTVFEYVCWASSGLVRGSISQGKNDIELIKESIQDDIDNYEDGERID